MYHIQEQTKDVELGVNKLFLTNPLQSSDYHMVLGRNLAKEAYLGIGFQGYNSLGKEQAIKSAIFHRRGNFSYGLGSLLFCVNDESNASNVDTSDIVLELMMDKSATFSGKVTHQPGVANNESATVGQLNALDLQAVTDNGNVTTKGATFGKIRWHKYACQCGILITSGYCTRRYWRFFKCISP